jgi:peptidase M66-like protein
MADGSRFLTSIDRLEIGELERARRIDIDRVRLPFSPYITGVEITQAIQYYKAASHLTDPNDRGADNSVGLAAFKPAWVRVYVRSGFFSSPVTLTGKIVLERQTSVFPLLGWSSVGEYTPIAPGSVAAPQSAAYATERSSLSSTLNFVLPAGDVHGRLRVRAIVWPVGGSAASPSDVEEVYADASLRQTLRVRGILVSYNGPNAAGTVAHMNLSAPTIGDLQATCANTHTVYPVESTGVYSSGGTINWNTPLTGVATNPGGCSQQWLDLNVAVAQAKANDGNRTDVLYVGLLPSGIPIANVGGCNSSGVSAVPNSAQWTMSHELGHACGLPHAPCGTPGDPNYPAYEPYDALNTPSASLGEYGLDINNGTIHPPTEKDWMSYCGPVWISLYNHSRLYNNNALDPRWVDTPQKPHIPELYDPWLWPWEYIPDPPSWELPSHFVRDMVQPVISIAGVVNLSNEINVSSVMRVRASAKLRSGTPTDMVAELIGASGEVVARAIVIKTEAHGSGCECGGDHAAHGSSGYAFHVLVPDVEPGAALRIVRIDPDRAEENVEVWSAKPGGPPVRVRGVVFRISKGEGSLTWDVTGSRERALQYSIQFSKDRGKSWNGLAAGILETEYRFSTGELPSGTVVFRVLAHDGFYSAYGDAKPVKLKPRAPIVTILHPYQGRSYQAGLPLRLVAAVNTHLGALNPALRLQWFVDGRRVGEGPDVFVATLKPGRHACRVVARDDGGESEARVTFTTQEEGSEPPRRRG